MSSKRTAGTTPAQPDQVCAVKDCGKEAAWNGLCRSCYGQAKRLIENEETTWDELIEMGLATGRPKPLLAEFRRLKGLQPSAAREHVGPPRVEPGDQ